MPASIHDVAALAGVSVATVSRSFTIPQAVREETRAAVLAAAEQLGYQPNRAARGLITGRTGNVGVIVPELGNPFFLEMLGGAQARARKADYAVFVADGRESATEEAALIAAMRKQVDGIILCSSRLPPRRLAALDPVPTLVLVNRKIPGLPAIILDSAGGMRQAVRHLAELGHRRCAFVSGPRASWSNRQRRQALLAETARLGVEVAVLGPVSPQFESGVDVAEAVLAARVSAVLAYNDLVAVGILSRMAALGVAVPEELSVVGFDDIALAAMVTPPLTTVALPAARAGEAAVEVLMERLDGPVAVRSAGVRELPAQLVVRSSTGPPPG